MNRLIMPINDDDDDNDDNNTVQEGKVEEGVLPCRHSALVPASHQESESRAQSKTA